MKRAVKAAVLAELSKYIDFIFWYVEKMRMYDRTGLQ